ncbi:MAG: hypothetical protein QM638_10055 [Nocardioides sp.]|uniref:hypothetical protein n=1 Tax=Nocardioides sp. TaxID=35761 RepID=UPI0039E55126
MSRLLSLIGAVLVVVLTGCGTDSTSAPDADPITSSAGSTSDTAGLALRTTALRVFSPSAAVKSRTTALVMTSPDQINGFVRQFGQADRAKVRAAVEGLSLAVGKESLAAQIVYTGCTLAGPDAVTVEATKGTIVLSAEVHEEHEECYAPVTSLGLAVIAETQG